MQVSKSQFKQIVMPPIGTMVEDKYKVDYVHYGKLKFTAKGTPMMGDLLIWEGRKYIVNYFIKEDKFYAEFAGFVENPTVENNVKVEDITCDCGECGDNTMMVDIDERDSLV